FLARFFRHFHSVFVHQYLNQIAQYSRLNSLSASPPTTTISCALLQCVRSSPPEIRLRYLCLSPPPLTQSASSSFVSSHKCRRFIRSYTVIDIPSLFWRLVCRRPEISR